MKRILILALILVLLPFTIKVLGNDFGQSVSLFTDVKANKVGDILTVLIFEQNQGSSKAETKTEKSTTASMKGGPGIGPLDFIPLFSVDGNNNNSFDGKGENVRNGSLRAKMSVTVIARKNNGDLIIQGSRTLGISGDRETLTLNGVVRQKDITRDNTIDSYLIADAEISYSGKGTATTGSRPGFFTRLFNWVF